MPVCQSPFKRIQVVANRLRFLWIFLFDHAMCRNCTSKPEFVLGENSHLIQPTGNLLADVLEVSQSSILSHNHSGSLGNAPRQAACR
jgi:hypothetical protein